MNSLIITNGDDAVARMREAGVRGEILPWRDILHEGPVPPSLLLEDLSAVRADFLAQRGWLAKEELNAAFRSRDAMIRRHNEFESVVLWFEHDLYDQLQLIQLLDFFATERREGLYLIQAGRYLGIAIAGMVNLFNPTMIVFGGGVAQIGDLFLQPIRDEVQKRSLPAAVRTLRIQTAVLRRRSSSMGAVVLALSMALHKLAEAKERR